MDSIIRGKKLKIPPVIFLVFLCCFAGASAAKVQLVEGETVKVKFASGMEISSGRVQTGIPLLIYLAEPVIIGGKTIIEKGAEGKAEVLEVKKASKPGKPGYIKIGFVELKPKGEYNTIGESKIKLAGEAEAEGKGKKLLSYLFIFGLFIKGGQAALPTNKIYSAKIGETIIMSSD